MREPFAHSVGGILSADIAVPEHEEELRFYSRILTTGDSPLWREDLMNSEGTPIIGLGARTPDYEALPLQWMPHFQVADVGASVRHALERGGQELMHSKGDDGQSQWAVLVDPNGAAFGLIPVVSAESSSKEPAGRIAWLTLAVSDAAATRDFYQHVVGWWAKTVEREDKEGRMTNFEMQRSDGVSSAEICPSRGDHEGLPSVWLISLPVADFEESLRRVRNNGGQVIKEEKVYAVIRDPVGVYFALQAQASGVMTGVAR